MKQILIFLSGRHLLTGVKIKSQINLFTEKLSSAVPFLRSHQSSSLNPPRALLQQIASLLCKFVQAISWASLGAPVWQQEWLKSWLPCLLPLGTGMRVASQLSLRLHAIVTSPVFLQPLFCSCPRLSPRFIIWRHGNEVWLFQTKDKGWLSLTEDQKRLLFHLSSQDTSAFITGVKKTKNTLIQEMKYAEPDEGSDMMACDVGRAHIRS